MIDLWEVWKDDTQQPLDSIFGWWVGTKDNCIWIGHKSVADAICNQHNTALAQARAPLVEALVIIRQQWHGCRGVCLNCDCVARALDEALTGTGERETLAGKTGNNNKKEISANAR